MKNKKVVIIVFSVFVVLLLFGGTFAYLQWASSNSQKTNVTFTTASTFSCSADGGGNITSENYKLVPSLCTNEGYAIKRTVHVNATVDTTAPSYHPVYLDMWLKVNSISSGLAGTTNFKYALTRGGNSCSDQVLARGNFSGSDSTTQKQLLHNVYFPSTSTNTYYLWIWLDAAEEEDLTMNQMFNLSLGGSCTNIEPESLVPTFISSNALLDEDIDFTEDAGDDNGEGVYIRSGTENDVNPIYYYRGDVDDNNVYFANNCWKMVRTTETGGLKLIYNGEPTSESTCDDDYVISDSGGDSGRGATRSLSLRNENVKNNAFHISYSQNYSHIGSGPFTLLNSRNSYVIYINNEPADSDIKNVVDNFYEEVLSDYATYLEDTVWCSDLSVYAMEAPPSSAEAMKYNFENSAVVTVADDGFVASCEVTFATAMRVANSVPSLACDSDDGSYTVSSSNGNGLLDYPIGLLTVDEAMLVGVNSYLQNGSDWWTMSPSRKTSCRAYNYVFPGLALTDEFNTRTVVTASEDLFFDEIVTNSFVVRPAISLAPGYNFVYGDGTGDDPYRFDETIAPGPVHSSSDGGGEEEK